ncbi:hypothetical protein GCM10007874_21950 [Labrys miyagiensis]|uniref:Uncharacterized protein n=1 Tax=Labrys miyagiensis TaxID=346912 RepID=A0ABQ6CHJ0_9HYPH|nr:hypothetical protein [Labrys miyagiensis]GLS19178.1 hypothetical protein GCM10007874_21950 [Labrys miyagiensis]
MADDTENSSFDLSLLLHPAQAFDHPRDVLADPDLTLHEKHAILASWASDACALEAAPALREIRRGWIVPFDDLMDALRALDSSRGDGALRYDRSVRRRKFSRSCFEGGNRLAQ